MFWHIFGIFDINIWKLDIFGSEKCIYICLLYILTRKLHWDKLCSLYSFIKWSLLYYYIVFNLYLLDEDEEDLVEEDEDCVSAAQLLGHSTNEGYTIL